MQILQSITVSPIEIASVAEPETEPEANLVGRSIEATTIEPENEEILEVPKILLIITPRKKDKRIVKFSAKIVKIHV